MLCEGRKEPPEVHQAQKMAILELLEDFAQNTSMKGVPRAVKSDKTYFRLLWTVAVVFFGSVGVWQIVTLIQGYLAYPTNTNVYNTRSNIAKDNSMPQHTVCTLRPVSFDAVLSSAYNDRVQQFVKCENCTEDMRKSAHLLATYAASPQAFFQYLGREGAAKQGISQEEMIAACSVRVQRGTIVKMKSCDEVNVTIRQMVHPTFFNCYQLSLPPARLPEFVPVGINLILFVRNTDVQQYVFFNPREEYTQSAGVFFILSDPHTIPFSSESFGMAAAGMHTEVVFSVREMKRLQEPYGKCNDAQYLEVHDLPGYIIPHDVKYTADSCELLCNTHVIREQCGCTDAEQSKGLVDATAEFPFCTNISLPALQLSEYHRCLRSTNTGLNGICFKRCTPACLQTTYRTTLSSALWPLRAFQEAFFKRYIVNGPLKDKFDKKVEELQGDDAAQNTTCDKSERKETLIRTNFLKLSTKLQTLDTIIYEDTVLYSISGIMSQMGGLLNLWSGITIYLFVEIVEFMIRVVTSWLDCNKAKVQSEKNNLTVQGKDINYVKKGGSYQSKIHH